MEECSNLLELVKNFLKDESFREKNYLDTLFQFSNLFLHAEHRLEQLLYSNNLDEEYNNENTIRDFFLKWD